MKMGSRVKRAVTPVIATILIISIVLSAISIIFIWGIPYMEKTKIQTQQTNVANQLSIMSDSIKEMIGSGTGATVENRISFDSGYLSANPTENREVFSYSLDPDYNFSVSGLDDRDNTFRLEMKSGSISKIKAIWESHKTSYSGMYHVGSTGSPSHSPPTGYFYNYNVYNIDGDTNKAYKIRGASSETPISPSSISSEYTSNEYSNIENDDTISNKWYGDTAYNNGKFVNLIYKMKINEDPSKMEKMKLKWKGIDTLSNGGYQGFYIWNKTSSSWRQIGGNGVALRFDGLNDRVNIPSREYLKYRGGDLTICAWIYVEDGETTGKIISKPWNGQGQYNYYLYLSSGKISLFVGNGTTSKSIADPSPISTNEWHYVCGELKSDGSMELYVDGELAASGQYSIDNWTPSKGDSNLPLCIGSLYPYGSGWAGNEGFSFRGLISNVCLYNAALSQNEILQNMEGDAITDGLIGWWKLDDGHGTIAHDVVRYDDGTIEDGGKWILNRGSYSLKFDGADDYVFIDDSNSLNLSTFTVESWVKPLVTSMNSSPKWRYIVSKGSLFTPNYALVYAGDTDKFVVGFYNGTSFQSVSSDVIKDNRFYHVVGVFNGSYLNLYVDGRLISSKALSTSPVFNDNPLFIGGGDSRYFNGSISDVRIYNRALSDTEVLQNYKGNVTTQGLVSWWKFNEGYGNILHDYVEDNDGRIYGAQWQDYKNFALEFNGVNDYVSGYGSHQFGNITIVSIVKQKGWNGYHEPIFSWADSSNGIYLVLDSGKHLQFGIESNNNLYHTNLYNVGDSYLNKWVMYTTTWSGSTGDADLYVNNNLVNTVSGYPTGVVDLENVPFAFGKSTTGNWGEINSRYWGDIDEILIYDRVLSSEEVDQLYYGNTITNGLVSWWKMDEGYGDTLQDSIGDNDGTIYGAHWVYSDGSSLHFDGIDDYVDCGNDESLNLANAITVEARVKIGENAAATTILKKGPQSGGSATDVSYALYISNGKVYFYGSNGTSWIFDTNFTYPSDEWIDVSATFNGSTAVIYENGVEKSRKTGITDVMKTVPYDLYIGSKWAQYFNGSIDYIRIYNRALTSTEIQENYQGDVVTDGLISWWDFDEAKGIAAYDCINNNSGKLFNGPYWSPNLPPKSESTYVESIFGNLSNYVDDSDYVYFGVVGGKGESFTSPFSCTSWYTPENSSYCEWIGGYNVNGYEVQYSLDGGSWQVDPNSPYNPGSIQSTTIYLGPDHKVEFRVRSTKGSLYSDWITSTTTYTVPNAPSDVTATAYPSHISVCWNDNSKYEDGFEIERSVDGGSFSLLSRVESNVTSYSDTDVVSGHEYQYRVRSYKNVSNPSTTLYSEYSVSNTVTASNFCVYTEFSRSTGQQYQYRLYGHLEAPDSNSYEVWFVWDTTSHDDYTQYAYSTSHTSMSSSGNFDAVISSSNLHGFYFRAVASDGEDTIAGEEKIGGLFIGPVLNTLPADVTSLHATLNGNTTYNGDQEVWFVWDTEYHYDWREYANSTSHQSMSSSGSFSDTIYPPSSGIYHFRAVGKDSHGIYGYGLDLDFQYPPPNNPPNTPSTPSGPSSGSPSTSYTFSTSTTDPDGDSVSYYWDWGDGTHTGWTQYYSSGSTVSASHSWSSTGTYYIKVKAKDVHGATSDYSSSHSITISSSSCFLAGTKIEMADGSVKNIEDIKVGDLVKSYDAKTGEIKTGRVTEVFHHSKDMMTDYYLIINNDLKVTPNHPILVNGRWIPAGDIKVGDKLLDQNGDCVVVTSIERIYHKVPTYNLEVSDTHTYIANGIVVHNKIYICCFMPGTKITLADGSTKNIEYITAGDKVLSYDLKNHSIIEGTVTEPIVKVRSGYYDINHGFLKVTDDHPLYVKKSDGREGWAAIDPEKAKEGAYSTIDTIMKLEIGDELMTENGTWVKVYSMEYHSGTVTTYTMDVTNGNNYFANGVLAHNSCPPPPSCCLAPGTKITMADGSVKNIENIIPGDEVLSYDVNNHTFVPVKVTVMDTPIKTVYDINNGLISITSDHPILVRKPDGRMVWAAIDPDLSKNAYMYRNPEKLEIGDYILTQSGRWIEVHSIIHKDRLIKTYTFSEEPGPHNFFANGILVSNTASSGSTCTVACVASGSMVRMYNGEEKKVDLISRGDTVLSYNFTSGGYHESKVTESSHYTGNVYSINNGTLEVTDSHPLYVKKSDGREGWAAIDPEKARKLYGIDDVTKLQVGDYIYRYMEGWIPVSSISMIDGTRSVYTLYTTGGTNFFANDILVSSMHDRYNTEKEQSSHTLYENYVELYVYYNATDFSPPRSYVSSTDPEEVISLHRTTTTQITFYWSGYDDQAHTGDLLYSWILDGYDQGWHSWSSLTSYTYKDLYPGNYTFKVRAMDPAGNVEQDETDQNTLTFEIESPVDDIDVNINPGDETEITLSRPIQGFVSIGLYTEDSNREVRVGQILVVDEGSVCYELPSSYGTYKSLLDNGGVVLLYPGNEGYFRNNPLMSSTDGTIQLSIIQIVPKTTISVGGGGGTYVLRSTLTKSMIVEHMISVYNLRAQPYGTDKYAWMDYFKRYIGFSEENNDTLSIYKQNINLVIGYYGVEIELGGFS